MEQSRGGTTPRPSKSARLPDAPIPRQHRTQTRPAAMGRRGASAGGPRGKGKKSPWAAGETGDAAPPSIGGTAEPWRTNARRDGTLWTRGNGYQPERRPTSRGFGLLADWQNRLRRLRAPGSGCPEEAPFGGRARADCREHQLGILREQGPPLPAQRLFRPVRV